MNRQIDKQIDRFVHYIYAFIFLNSCILICTFTDRTRELLFSGSKRSFDIPRDANGNEIYPTIIAPVEDVNMEEDTSHDRQMLITNTGQLTAPEQNNKPANAFQALMMARKGI